MLEMQWVFGLINAIRPACRNAASVDYMMSNKTDSILWFTEIQASHSLDLLKRSVLEITKTVGLQCFLWESLLGLRHVLRTHSYHQLEAMLSCVTRKRRRHGSLRSK